MNQQKILWASVSGVSIAAAVVIGSVLAAANHHTPTPAEKPAGNVQPATVVTVTATPSVSRTTVAGVKVSPSTVKPAAPKRRAVVQQGAAVTDPTTTTPAPVNPPPAVTTTPAPAQTTDGQARPAPDQGGVVRKPRPTDGPTPPSLGPKPNG